MFPRVVGHKSKAKHKFAQILGGGLLFGNGEKGSATKKQEVHRVYNMPPPFKVRFFFFIVKQFSGNFCQKTGWLHSLQGLRFWGEKPSDLSFEISEFF